MRKPPPIPKNPEKRPTLKPIPRSRGSSSWAVFVGQANVRIHEFLPIPKHEHHDDNHDNSKQGEEASLTIECPSPPLEPGCSAQHTSPGERRCAAPLYVSGPPVRPKIAERAHRDRQCTGVNGDMGPRRRKQGGGTARIEPPPPTRPRTRPTIEPDPAARRLVVEIRHHHSTDRVSRRKVDWGQSSGTNRKSTIPTSMAATEDESLRQSQRQ